jgi:hypothetical protein
LQRHADAKLQIQQLEVLLLASITGSALGWTIIKELEWAKQFHIDAHFGLPSDQYGAQWRFTGLVLTAMAKMQAVAWIDLHQAEEMIMADKSDPFVMLMAIADLADVLGTRTLPHSESNRYRDLEAAARFRTIADEQYDRVLAIPTESMSVKELSTAIQGLVWYPLQRICSDTRTQNCKSSSWRFYCLPGPRYPPLTRAMPCEG